MKYIFTILALLISSNIFAMSPSDRAEKIKERFERRLHIQAEFMLAIDRKVKSWPQFSDNPNAIEVVGRGKIKVDGSFPRELLLAAYIQIPRLCAKLFGGQAPEFIDECLDRLLEFVDTLPNQKQVLLKALATKPIHFSLSKVYNPDEKYKELDRESLLRKIVAAQGPEFLNFNYCFVTANDLKHPKALEYYGKELGEMSLLQRYAAVYQDIKTVKFLLEELGADPEFVNYDDKTAAGLVSEKIGTYPRGGPEETQLREMHDLLTPHKIFYSFLTPSNNQ